MIGGRNREVAFLVSRTIPKIVVLAARIPAAFLRIDEVKSAVLVLIETDIVEDEKLGFGSEERRVGDTAILQIELGFFRDPARIAIIVLPRNRIDDIAKHHQRARFGERIEESRRRIGNDQHVAFIDGGPAADA